MSKERIKISLNEEDVQNILNAYERDIEYIEHLESVLKEIREYITGNYDFYYGDELYDQYEKILEIIDKGTKENE